MESRRYVDQRMFEQYDDFDGQEVQDTLMVSLSVGDAFDAWLKHIWADPDSGQMSTPGNGRGMLGSVKKIYGVEFKIMSVGEPSACEDQIPSIAYQVTGFGCLPVDEHLGFVRFVATDVSATTTSCQTLIIWEEKFIPTAFVGQILCCGGTIIRSVIRQYFQSKFQSLKRLYNKQK